MSETTKYVFIKNKENGYSVTLFLLSFAVYTFVSSCDVNLLAATDSCSQWLLSVGVQNCCGFKQLSSVETDIFILCHDGR